MTKSSNKKFSPQGDDLASLAARVRRVDRENVELFRRLVEGEQRFRGLAKAVWRVQEEERRRLARELHDSLGQTLTALKIQLVRLAEQSRDVDSELATELNGTVGIVHEALNDARRLSHLLRPRVLDDLGLAPALHWLSRTLGESTGFTVDLGIEDLENPGGTRLGAELETLIFRVVQEASTNALKHSKVDRAEVRIDRRGEFLRLSIEDQGQGFDPAAVAVDTGTDTGHGLAGIRDRVEIFGGRLRIDSSPGAGTRIEINLPLS